jgi:hypothetical protein
MPRVQVIADDGWVALDELATEQQTASEHYRRCLADRIHWAVGDAQRRSTAAGDARPAAALRTSEPALIAA